MTRSTICGSLLVLVALLTTSARADTAAYGWYAGGSYGTASFNQGFGDFFDGGPGMFSVDDSDTGWKIFGGRRLTEHFAIELSYVDLDNDVDEQTTLAGSDGSGAELLQDPASVHLEEAQATAIAVIGAWPLTDRATLLARAGAAAWEADRTTLDQAGRRTRSESGVDATFGAGFQYRVGERVELRLDWERYADIDGDDIDLLSLGVLVPLGSRKSR